MRLSNKEIAETGDIKELVSGFANRLIETLLLIGLNNEGYLKFDELILYQIDYQTFVLQ